MLAIVVTGASCAHGDDGCESDYELWIVEAHSAPIHGCWREGIADLRFMRKSSLLFHEEYTLEEFVAAMDGQKPVTIYVHGYGIDRPGAIIGANRLAREVGAGAGPFRMVLWTYDACHDILKTPRGNIDDKSMTADAQGYYLAAVISQLCPHVRLSLVGHSFGCRSISASLHGLATGCVAGERLPVKRGRRPASIQALLLAPAIPSESLYPGQTYGLAVSQVDRMLLTYNERDKVLRLLNFFVEEQVLGRTGIADFNRLEEQRGKVCQVDIRPSIGSQHRVAPFAFTPDVANAIRPYFVNQGLTIRDHDEPSEASRFDGVELGVPTEDLSEEDDALPWQVTPARHESREPLRLPDTMKNALPLDFPSIEIQRETHAPSRRRSSK